MPESTDTTTTDDIEIGRVGKVFLTLVIWVFFGAVTAGILEGFDILTGDTVAERFALIVFWPVFALKYLGLGGWEVLQAFWSLIQS